MRFPVNYTLQDLIGAGLACLLFIPILFVPGYVAAWFSDVLDFRGLSSPWKTLVSVPLSIALCPILTYWVGMGGSWTPVWVLYGFCFLIWLFLLTGMCGHDPFLKWIRGFRSVPRAGWIVPAIWFLVVIVSLVDLQIHDRLYFSFTDFDHEMRAAITGAISRTGVRPFNPFYFLGAPAALRYHHFWFLLCSLAEQVGGCLVSPRQAIIASAVWCGWSLVALVPLYLRFFHERTGAALHRGSLVAICLFTVTGLDVIPNLMYLALGRSILPDMEWWNEQVTSWIGSVLWVPHHVAALVAGLMGFLLTWNAGLASSRRRHIFGGLLAGMAFATAAGTSIYVTLVFAAFLSLWTVVTWFRRRGSFTVVLASAGMVAVLLASPHLHTLGGPGSGGSLVTFQVRMFYPVLLFAVARQLYIGQEMILRILALPLNYFLELGFFGAAGVAYLRRLRGQMTLRFNVLASVWMMGVSVWLCTFVKSGVIVNNDLGWRGFLPAQFILLLWGADLIVRRGESAETAGKGFHSGWLRSPIWTPLIVLGVASTVYELVLLRSYFLWNDAGLTAATVYAPDRQFGTRALEFRRAYEAMDHILLSTATVQANPEGHYVDYYGGLYSKRQIAVGGPACGSELGGDPANCPAAYANVSAIFDGHGDMTEELVEAVCRKLSIDALILDDLDGAWKESQSWAWKVKPAIEGRHVRVYLVGSVRRRLAAVVQPDPASDQ